MAKRKRESAGSSVSKRPKATPTFKKKRGVLIGDELKYNDVNFNTDASTTETVVALTTFASGDTALLRDGNKIIPKSIELRIQMGNEALTQNNTVRFVVVKSMQANAQAPTWFTGAATDIFDAATVTARRAVATASSYKIVMEHVEVINQGSSTGGALQQAYFHKYMKLMDDVTTYSGSGSTIPITNAYFLLYLGSTASGATDCDIVGTARVRFVG